MNFTPNPANAPLTGRVQQQQVHQVPVTTSAGAPQGGNMQKMPNPSFMLNQQAANMAHKVNDDNNKNQMPPSSGHHQLQQPAQNNNNHGMGAIPQQLLNVQHQQNMNRNLSHQSTFQQPPHLMMAAQKGGIFQQMQQMAYQSQPFPQGPPASVAQSQQPPIHHTGMPSQQNILQKLQATIPLIQMKPAPMQQTSPQHQMKPAPNHPSPPVSQHNMQYSPSKPIHPQMKTTAKLASPGSQLQSLQKSPTAPNLPALPLAPTQAASQNKNVPSTPPISSPSAPPLASPPGGASPTKTQVTAKVVQAAAPVAVPVPNIATSAVPSLTITTTPSPAKPAVVEAAPIKAVELTKEAIPAQIKSVPKPSVVDEKKPATVETNNKVDKPASTSVVAAPKAAVISPAPSKNTMRLATVTARQKKPPATNNVKKPPAPPVSPSVQRSPVKATPPPAKPPVEAPKPAASHKKLVATAAPPAVSPKINLGPSTSSAQSTSSSTSATSGKAKRSRVKVQPYQSPTPEIALVTKLSTQTANPTNKNGTDDKLTIFYKNEFLAVRNGEGTFYLCQTLSNVYKSSSKIRIRWLNEKEEGKVNEGGARTFSLDYYDVTDFECVLTTVELDKVERSYELPQSEQARIESILKKAIDVEKGIVPRPTVTEENPDGLDLSLYKDEAQLDKSPRKRKRDVKSESDDFEDEDYEESPRKRRIVKRASPSKRTPARKQAVVNDESTESDEENLMEIKKKAKKAANTATPKAPEKALEPMPSTSKASATPAKGRKRAAPKPVEAEIPEKITKPDVEAAKEAPAAKTPATKAKAVAKAKPVKKTVSEVPTPVEEKKVAPEKKTIAEKKPAAKKAQPAEEKAIIKPQPSTPTVKTTPEKAATKTTPAKKTPAKTKASPAATTSTAPQQPATPSTSRSRNTRSKK